MFKKIALILCIGLTLSFAAEQPKVNPDTGLIIDPDSPLVEANCLACHGSGLITNMRASKQAWLAAIRWMQESEGLWEIPANDEERILNYLTKYYGEKYDTRRRIPLVLLEK
ncbi:cytochrome C [Campylobacter lari]|uniref:sulfite:cytochrome c oxidoreductase monoheme cytochrome C subunit n=1 Tax=Campylobacter lari TaxID=201 RepID=UPI001275356C|nr:cytochrome C [Campylobacter lari]EAL2459534.1 cytochrome C [Campylobacter lari]EAL3935421.1 cytochrome C [Campylobacter lari]